MKDTNSWIAFIRHGATEWNASGRIQGHTDVPLSVEGRRIVGTWSIPRSLLPDRWLCSPLRRAVETATLLGCDAPEIEASLIEMHWGSWEGLTLEELRTDGDMQTNEQRGLDFTPTDGETPREVRERLQVLLLRVGGARQNCIAVTHKGVIRAALSLATGWDMRDEPPFKLRWDKAHVFDIDPEGRISVQKVNVTLDGD